MKRPGISPFFLQEDDEKKKKKGIRAMIDLTLLVVLVINRVLFFS